MEKQNDLAKTNTKTTLITKTNRGKRTKNEMPLYIAFLLVNLLPTIVSLLQTGQINMAVNVAQGLASCVLIIKIAIDRK